MVQLYYASLEEHMRQYLKNLKLDDLNNNYQRAQNKIVKEGLDMQLSRAEIANRIEAMKQTLKDNVVNKILPKYEPDSNAGNMGNSVVSKPQIEKEVRKAMNDMLSKTEFMGQLKDKIANPNLKPTPKKEVIKAMNDMLNKTEFMGQLKDKIANPNLKPIPKEVKIKKEVIKTMNEMLNKIEEETKRRSANSSGNSSPTSSAYSSAYSYASYASQPVTESDSATAVGGNSDVGDLESLISQSKPGDRLKMASKLKNLFDTQYAAFAGKQLKDKFEWASIMTMSRDELADSSKILKGIDLPKPKPLEKIGGNGLKKKKVLKKRSNKRTN